MPETVSDKAEKRLAAIENELSAIRGALDEILPLARQAAPLLDSPLTKFARAGFMRGNRG